MLDFIVNCNHNYVDLYLRLSRDDNQRGTSISIENQNEILTNWANRNGYEVRTRYIDDGISGYSFNRPDFNELKAAIESGTVKRVLIKDLSRLGRHNARVLLFMEDAKDSDCEVIAIDDNYSNFQDNDSTIGIKTWHNELYVKESHKKVKNLIRFKQEKGEWIPNVPYGFKKIPFRKHEFEEDDVAIAVVKRIFDLFVNENMKFMQIKKILNAENVSPPAMRKKELRLLRGEIDYSNPSDKWTEVAIKRILQNDFYIGILVQRKGECKKIRGNYQLLSKEFRIYFENHHKAIIDLEQFVLAQQKIKNNYPVKVVKRKKHNSLFADLIFCGECGNKMLVRHSKKDIRTNNARYYCKSYLKNGKNFCDCKSISDEDLKQALNVLLIRCKLIYHKFLENLTIKNEVVDNQDEYLQNKILNLENELQMIIQQKLDEMIRNPRNKEIIENTYQKIIDSKIEEINYLKNQQITDEHIKNNDENIKNQCNSALNLLEDLIKTKNYSREIVERLIDKIIVYKNNKVKIVCKANIDELIDNTIVIKDNELENFRFDIIECFYKKRVGNKVSLLEVHKSMLEKGYTYSYKHTFMNQIKEFENKGIIIRKYKNKAAEIAISKEKALSLIKDKEELMNYDSSQNIKVLKLLDEKLVN